MNIYLHKYFFPECVGSDCSCNCKYEITEDKCKTNDCEGITCQNGGTCQDKTNGYMCNCQEEFSGINCQNDNGILINN